MATHKLVASGSTYAPLYTRGSRPFYASNGTIVVPLQGGFWLSPNRYKTAMHCGDDGGNTWSVVQGGGAAVFSYVSRYPVDCVQVGDTLAVCYYDAEDSSQLCIRAFDMLDQTWGDLIASGGPAVPTYSGSIQGASTGGLTLKYHGGNYYVMHRVENDTTLYRTGLSVWDGSTWTTHDTFADVITAEHAVNYDLAVRSNGDVLAIGTDAHFYIYVQTLTAAGVLGDSVPLWDSAADPQPTDMYGQSSNMLAPGNQVQTRLIGDRVYWGWVAKFGSPDDALNLLADVWVANLNAAAPEYLTWPPPIAWSPANAGTNTNPIYPQAPIAYGATGLQTVGIVTVEDTDTLMYHDITDLVSAGQKLQLWPYYRVPDIFPYPKVYGAYFDDSGIVGDPFLVYESEIAGSENTSLIGINLGELAGCCEGCAIIF